MISAVCNCRSVSILRRPLRDHVSVWSGSNEEARFLLEQAVRTDAGATRDLIADEVLAITSLCTAGARHHHMAYAATTKGLDMCVCVCYYQP